VIFVHHIHGDLLTSHSLKFIYIHSWWFDYITFMEIWLHHIHRDLITSHSWWFAYTTFMVICLHHIHWDLFIYIHDDLITSHSWRYDYIISIAIWLRHILVCQCACVIQKLQQWGDLGPSWADASQKNGKYISYCNTSWLITEKNVNLIQRCKLFPQKTTVR